MTSIHVLMITLLNISDPSNVVMLLEAVPYVDQVKCKTEEKRLKIYYKGKYEHVLIKCVNKGIR